MAAPSSVLRAGDEADGATALRFLGRTGMRVSSLCLGGMGFGSWANSDQADCERIIHTALDAGINFIETADAYSGGESEEIIGKAIAGRRDEVVLATKFSTPMGPGALERGGSRRWINLAVEGSLRRLGTDWIDLYQLHRLDPETELEETLDALSDLVRQGKVRCVGTSTASPHQIVQGQWVSDRRGLRRFMTEQPPYSMLVRKAEAEALPVMQEYGMGVMCWSPLAGGWLSGTFQDREGVPLDEAQASRAKRMPERFDLSTAANQRKLTAVRELAGLADRTGVTLPHMAVAFVLTHPAVTSAIIGPRTIEHLTGLIGAESLVLGDDVLDMIDEIVPPGTTVNPADDDHLSPIGLRAKAMRRRTR